MTPFGGGYILGDPTVLHTTITLMESPQCTTAIPVQWPQRGPETFVDFGPINEPKAQRRDWYRQFERSARHRRR